MNIMKLSVLIVLASLMLNSVNAQEAQPVDATAVIKPVKLAGPRVGITILSGEYIDAMEETYDTRLQPALIQFGWQFEKRFFTLRNGFSGVTEWVVLVGGFEQNKFIPSITWLIGGRTSKGFEMGIGPNLAPSGTSVVFGMGMTFTSDQINFPVNLAVSNSPSGPRFSLLVGFNTRK